MSKIPVVIVLFFAFSAYAQQERIAIMNTVDDLDSVGFSDLNYLTDKLRDIAGKVLSKSRFGIMTQQSIVDRLGSQERMVKECKAATCLADLGRRVSADYVSQGRVGRFSDRLTIKVELYTVKNSNLLGSFTGDSKDLDGLLSVLEAKAPKLFEEMQEISSAVPEKPAPPKPVPLAPPENVPLPPAVSDLEKAADIELGYKVPENIDPQVEMEEFQPSNKSFWVALALDVAGAVLIANGIIKNSEAKNMHDDYSSLSRRNATQSEFDDAWANVDSAKTDRNISFALGSLLLATGIGVHIWF